MIDINSEIPPEVARITDEFVNNLNGRFKEHVGDRFLKSVLACKISENKILYKESLPAAARNAGIMVFHFMLEKLCQAPCNGHLIAQAFERAFTKPKPSTNTN